MAQAKKKTTTRKTIAKKPVKKTVAKRSATPVRARQVATVGHADPEAKSLVAWVVLGLVAVAFVMWILTDYKNLQDNFNNVDEGSSHTPAVRKNPQP